MFDSWSKVNFTDSPNNFLVLLIFFLALTIDYCRWLSLPHFGNILQQPLLCSQTLKINFELWQLLWTTTLQPPLHKQFWRHTLLITFTWQTLSSSNRLQQNPSNNQLQLLWAPLHKQLWFTIKDRQLQLLVIYNYNKIDVIESNLYNQLSLCKTYLHL